MNDWLTKKFEDATAGHADELTAFQLFQKGVTAGAAAMRERAVVAVREHADMNDAINAVGVLSDIPEEK
jgi:hypothetical protein